MVCLTGDVCLHNRQPVLSESSSKVQMIVYMFMICQLIFFFKAAPLRHLSLLSLFTKVLIL